MAPFEDRLAVARLIAMITPINQGRLIDTRIIMVDVVIFGMLSGYLAKQVILPAE
jgi:hypothetical protein